MLTNLTFIKDHRGFQKGFRIEFKPGINLLVGDQGTGKSTLLQQLAQFGKLKNAPSGDCAVVVLASKPVPVGYFDFEKHNPRIQPGFGMGYGYDTATQVQSMFQSHGEFVRDWTAVIGRHKGSGLYLLDEPDAALCPRSAYTMARAFKAAETEGAQIVAAVHNPILIESETEVFSTEHRKWVPSKVFMELMRTTTPPAPRAR